MPVWVGGRQVYVNTQKSQTVKICSAQNKRGFYEKYYRIDPSRAVPQATIELTISRFAGLADLERWLLTEMKAAREPQNEQRPITSVQDSRDDDQPPETKIASPNTVAAIEHVEDSEAPVAVAEILDLLSSARYFPNEDPWLPEAKNAVESSINTLVRDFMDLPYLHRVEHSIHAELFQLMLSHSELAKRVSLGEDLTTTQLIHKEWPESVARDGSRRGNFDIIVLSPQQLRGCPSIRAFREGHLYAPIVIEIGLDYDAEHLAIDAKKLLNSQPRHGYLIHLVRERPREPAAEQIILGMESKFGIKTAYGWISGRQAAYKFVDDGTIREK